MRRVMRRGGGRGTPVTVRRARRWRPRPVRVEVPRDRNGSFEPRIVPKRARRLSNINEMILSLYSRGMTMSDIAAHLREVYGIEASKELISNVTDVVVDEVKAWQSRPLDEVYPILYIDGIRL